MSEIVERAAQATYEHGTEAASDPYVTPWKDLKDKHRDIWRDQVRSTIAAMREPTEAMIAAGYDVDYSPDPLPGDKVWRAMIDEALK